MKLRYALLPLCLLTAMPSLAATRGLDVRDMIALDRVSSPLLTADGGNVIFAKRVVGADSKASTGLFIRNLRTRDLAPPKPLTPTGWNVNSAALSADGQTVYFLSAKNGSQQLYAQPTTGGTPRQLTDFPVDVDSFHVSPQGDRVAFSSGVFRTAVRTWPAPARNWTRTRRARTLVRYSTAYSCAIGTPGPMAAATRCSWHRCRPPRLPR